MIHGTINCNLEPNSDRHGPDRRPVPDFQSSRLAWVRNIEVIPRLMQCLQTCSYDRAFELQWRPWMAVAQPSLQSLITCSTALSAAFYFTGLALKECRLGRYNVVHSIYAP